MIFGYVGTPGSGKSYEAVIAILDNLKTGRVVYTNVEGIHEKPHREMIKNVCGLSEYALTRQLKEIEDNEIIEFWNHIEPKCLIVIDEVQNYFNSRDWQSQKNRDFGTWASTHRHHGYDCICITQRPDRVDSAVRGLWEWTYLFRKVNFFGGAVTKKYMVYAYAGDDIHGPPLSKKVKTYHPSIFGCYKSYVTDDIKEIDVIKHVNVLKHPIFFAIPLVLGLTIYLVFFKSSFKDGDLFGNAKVIAASQERMKKTKKVESKSTEIAYNDHTPNIFKVENNSGSLTFTNRSKHEKADN